MGYLIYSLYLVDALTHSFIIFSGILLCSIAVWGFTYAVVFDGYCSLDKENREKAMLFGKKYSGILVKYFVNFIKNWLSGFESRSSASTL